MLNNTSFEGFRENCLTFKKYASSTVKKGDFVTVVNGNEVKRSPKNTDIVGKAVDVNGDYITVQLSGYMTGTVAALQTVAYGYQPLSLDIDQNITFTETNRKVLVVYYDSATSTVGFIL